VTDFSRDELLLTASLARALAQVAAALDDPEVCDSHLLFELLALADRAELALGAERPAPPSDSGGAAS
jgi:hypothetical protein